MNQLVAFRLKVDHGDVQVWEQSTLRLPASSVLISDLVSWGESELPTDEYGLEGIRPARHALKSPAGSRPFHGFIVARKPAAIAPFLREHYDPQPGTALAGVLAGPVRAIGDRVEAALSGPELRYGRRHGRFRHAQGITQGGEVLGLFVAQNRIPHGFARVHVRGVEWLALENDTNRVWRAPTTTRIGHHDIPGEVFVRLNGAREGTRTWFDGRRYGASDSTDTLPPGLRARLEASGTPVGFAARHGAPLADLEPLFLLKIPPSKHFKIPIANLPPVPPEARRAGFVLDSRAPIPLVDEAGNPRSIPVIERPADVVSILARVGAGVHFVPHAEPADPRDLAPPAAGSWRIGAIPRFSA